MLIYKIKNLLNNKIYIGQTTVSLDSRISAYKSDVRKFKNGKYKAKSHIIRALAQDGFENFIFYILEEVDSQILLDQREKFWIAELKCTDRNIGYNIQLGGFGVGKHSAETKKIMSDKKKGKPPPNKGKQGLSGENVGNAKLTQIQVAQIREEYSIIKSAAKLAEKYNVSKPTILSIINNKRYKTKDSQAIVIQRPWFVYLIQSLKDNSIYTGATLDVEARLKTHNNGRGARYTRSRKPFILLKFFEFRSKQEALSFEYHVKQLSREEKLKL